MEKPTAPSSRQAEPHERHTPEATADLLRLLDVVAAWFRREYWSGAGGRARSYVEGQRGLRAEVVEEFGLGYAPPTWSALTGYLAARRVPHELAELAGLVRRKRGAVPPTGAPPAPATHYDVFRNRVIFPLRAPATGEVIAFGGRLIEDEPDAPKYLNSPETPLYKKGEQLYGWWEAQAAIRERHQVVVVEGNFDVLMLHDRGLTETVAPMGTALTPAQVRLIAAANPDRVCAMFDGDDAGSAAAARAVGVCIDEGLKTRVALLPPGTDPDSYMRTAGEASLVRCLFAAVEDVDFYIHAGARLVGASIMEQSRYLEEAMQLIARVQNPVARQRHAERLAILLDFKPEDVADLLRRAR